MVAAKETETCGVCRIVWTRTRVELLAVAEDANPSRLIQWQLYVVNDGPHIATVCPDGRLAGVGRERRGIDDIGQQAAQRN